MKRNIKRIAVIIILFAVCFFCGKVNGYAEPEVESDSIEQKAEPSDVEMVVLLDTSESMADGGIWDEAKTWAMEIGAYSLETDIFLRVICFDGKDFYTSQNGHPNTRDVFSGKVTDGQSLVDCQKSLKRIKADGIYTDHKGAMEYVQKVLGDSVSSYQCILILSDGDLDYDNGKENPNEYTEDEKTAIDAFKDMVREFAAQDNQSVILVGFGKGKAMLRAAADTSQAAYYDGENQRTDAIEEIFRKLGYPVEAISEFRYENPVIFNVMSDCYRVITNVHSQEQDQGPLRGEEIEVTGPKDWNSREQEYIPLDRSGYLYLSSVVEGEYRISFPSDQWLCSVKYQCFSLPDELHFRILQNGEEVVEDIQTGSYYIKGTSFEIAIDELDMSNTQVFYSYSLVGESVNEPNEIKLTIGDYESNRGIVEFEKADQEYIFQVICKQGGLESKSIPISIITSDLEDSFSVGANVDVNIEVGDKISLSEYSENAAGCQLRINDKDQYTVALNNALSGKDIEYSGPDEYVLVFRREGKYKLCVTDIETGKVYFEQSYNVTKTSIWQAIVEWFISLWRENK